MIKQKNKKTLTIMITLLMFIGAVFSTTQVPVHQAEARGLVGRFLCKFDLTKEIYQMTETDYFTYLLRSKSALAQVDRVDKSILNKLLGVAGYKFGEVNEAILGREINSVDISDISADEANASAPKVSAFDRFGMSGLTWSSYAGEWKYSHVDTCSESGEVSPTNYGAFYDSRLEPKTTANQVATSDDARSIQFSKGFASIFSSTFMNVISNSIFSLAKFIVTLTIIFVGLAFTDVTTLIGMTSEGVAGGTASAMFTTLFNTIFTGFVLITFLFTAVYIMYNAFVKRQMRLAVNTLIKTVLIFIVATIMASNPSYWIGIPNKAAMYGQSLVLNSVAGRHENDSDYVSLCTSNVGSLDEGVDFDGAKDTDGLLTEFEKMNENMRSVIGCQLWEQFLFKPWVRGQFGVEYEDLSSDKLGNVNSEWVGKGSVPLGDGKTVDNWALFQLSTQTDAHAQIGNDNFPVYVNGVNADWWRTVDALSNYDEEQVMDTVDKADGTIIGELEMTGTRNTDPAEAWQTWIGNNSSERITTAVIAVLFGIVGSIAPLVFGLGSAITGLGITIMMMTAPVFLLLGTWGGRGDGIFLGWLGSLANMVIKKIGYSLLLIISISITMSLMDLAYKIGLITSFILLIVVTVVLIKNKDKLLGILASVDFGGTFDPRTRANEIKEQAKDAGSQVGGLALAGIAGGVTGRKTGQGFFRGANIATANQLQDTLYRSNIGRYAAMEMNSRKTDSSQKENYCQVCNKHLGKYSEEIAYMNDDGLYFCENCADEMGTEELHEVILDDSKKSDNPLGQERTKFATSNRSYLSHGMTRNAMDSTVINGDYHWNNNQVQSTIKDNMKRLREDIVVFKNMQIDLGGEAKPPSIPEPLHTYIDLAMINEAWSRGDMDIVENTYKAAWKMWYEDNGENVSGLTTEEIERFKKELDNYSPDITAERSEELTDTILSGTRKKDDDNDESKSRHNERGLVYTYIDGKLELSERHVEIDEVTEVEEIKGKKANN